MIPIVLVGGGGHAKVVAAILLKHAGFRPIGYTDLSDRGPLVGLPYLGTDDTLGALLHEQPGSAAALAIGSVTDTSIRRAAASRLLDWGYRLPAIISPVAVVNEGATLEDGAQVFDAAVVNPSACVGRFVILNTGSIVEHDVVIGEFSHLSPGATVCGGARIGADVLIGAGATVVHGASVADGCIVGAGAVVTQSIDVAGVYVGAPARRIR